MKKQKVELLKRIAKEAAQFVKVEQIKNSLDGGLNAEVTQYLVNAFKEHKSLTYSDYLRILDHVKRYPHLRGIIWEEGGSTVSKNYYKKLSLALCHAVDIKTCLEISNANGAIIEDFAGKFPKVKLAAVIEDELFSAIANNSFANPASFILSSIDKLEENQKFDVIWDYQHLYDDEKELSIAHLNRLSAHLHDYGFFLCHSSNQFQPTFIKQLHKKSNLKLSAIIQLEEPIDPTASYLYIFTKYFNHQIFVAKLDNELMIKAIANNYFKKNTEALQTGKYMELSSFINFRQLEAEEKLSRLGAELNFTKVKLEDLIRKNYIKEQSDKYNSLYLTRKKSLFDKIGLELNKYDGDIEQLDLSSYDITLADMFLDERTSNQITDCNENILNLPLVNFQDRNFSYSTLGYPLDIKELFNHQMIKIPIKPEALNKKYFLNIAKKPLGQLLLTVIYAYIEEQKGKFDIQSIYNINAYFDSITVQNKQVQIIEKLDDSIKQFQSISETLEEEKYQEKIKTILSTWQSNLENHHLNSEDLNQLVEDFLEEPYYSTIKQFDLQSEKEMKRNFPNHSEINKIGTINGFLRTGEWVWHQYKDILKYQNPDSFDYTFLVANHFKALELYLCKKLANSCRGDRLNDYVIGDDQYFLQTTLGNYRWYINSKKFGRKYNPFKTGVTDEEKTTVNEQLIEWIRDCRNSYQHKDMLGAIEEAKNIRDRTKALFILFEKVLK